MNARGVVACGHPATARAACDVLEDGGNAFDAALAAMCAACVAEPALASLGGGGFLMAWPRDARERRHPILYDFFPQTPRRRRQDGRADLSPIMADFGPAQQEFHIGMASIATPGMVRGLFRVHGDLGCMPLRRVVEPATALARGGVKIDAMQAYVLSVVGAILRSRPDTWNLFRSRTRPDAVVAEGETLSLPAMADVLEVLAIEGDDLFYRGEIARAIVADCDSGGGHLSAADLAGYRVECRRPLTCDAFGARVLLNPPPSTGGILMAFALQTLDDPRSHVPAFGSVAYVNRLITVMDLTNQARSEAALHDVDVADRVSTLLDPELIARYRALMADHPQVTRGTTHISVIDAAGNAAALSVSNGEGSGYVVPGTAIMLNNVLGEEDINPHGFQAWPTDTRLGSMMAPSIVVESNGSTTALGSGGSKRICTALLQVLVDLLALGMPLDAAVDAPRLHRENDLVSVEPGFDEAAIADLRHGPWAVHVWPHRNLFFGGVHVARRHAGGGLSGAGDPRRAGVACVA
jgi:gamma-glutamyltranspeptidase/glutathione hydrolase